MQLFSCLLRDVILVKKKKKKNSRLPCFAIYQNLLIVCESNVLESAKRIMLGLSVNPVQLHKVFLASLVILFPIP